MATREAAHERGIHVLVDLVPNHTSSEHPWFQAALTSGPDSPERARYLFYPLIGAMLVLILLVSLV